MADVVLAGVDVVLDPPDVPSFVAAPPSLDDVVLVPLEGPQGAPGEAAEGPIDPVDLYLANRALEA